MPEEDIEQREETAETPDSGPTAESPPPRKSGFFNRRNAVLLAGGFAVLAVILAIFAVVSYKYGIVDNYIKTQFTAKMQEIGIDFDATVFRVTIAPLELHLQGATFNNRVTGERLFFVRDARLGLTVQDLYAWQLSRDLSIDTTEISGAEVWVNFDENGRSNFSELALVEDESGSRVNFKYQSMKFSLTDSVVHVGDLTRKITADANNIQFFLEPENYDVPDEQKRYKIDFTTSDSTFIYDGNPLEDISIRAVGIADKLGADITELRIETPVGVSSLTGRLTDWAALKYDLNIESTVDLTQASSIFPLGMPLKGIGNFKGRVSGQGETYNVDGAIDSEALTAGGIYLRAVNVAATVTGTNSSYEANGNAVAELLTFDDFRIEFPKIAGNVRGTGTDFRWVGELQAVAAKTGALTMAGLFLSDAVAEYKDNQIAASSGTARVQKFSIADTEFADLMARNLRISSANNRLNITAPSASASSMETEDYSLRGLSGRNVRITDGGQRTDVAIDGLRADSAEMDGNRVRGLTADRFEMTDLPTTSDIDLHNMRADRVDGGNFSVEGVSSPLLTIRDNPNETIIYSDTTRVARIDSSAAELGSLNIAGVRLSIRQGRIEGRSNDIDAGNVTLKQSATLAEGGSLENVRIASPVFVVEPSGRYRASADMSIGGGTVGTIPLGEARAAVNINNDRVELTGLDAAVMDGRINGEAVIAFSERTRSNINAVFSNLDLSKIVALQGGRIIPLEGQTSGSVDLAFNGMDFGTASGSINADITANAGTADSGLVPVNGRVEVTADDGLFNVEQARLTTGNSELTASGRFDLRNTGSDLDIALRSNDASEIDRLIRVLGISPELEQQLDSMQVEFAGNLNFTGNLTGNAADPFIDGRADLDSLIVRGRDLGTVGTDISVSPLGIGLENGRLQERGGGNIAFNVNIPSAGANNITVNATLTDVNAGNLLSALPVALPARLRDFTGRTSGTVDLSGLPSNSQGEINIASTGGTVAGQAFDSLNVRAVFAGTLIDLQNAEIRVGDGFVRAGGTYDHASHVFDLDLTGTNVPLPLALAFLPESTAVPTITGLADFTASAAGDTDAASSYNINFSGAARDVVVNDNPFGPVTFKGDTVGGVLNAALTTTLGGHSQEIAATVDFRSQAVPFSISHRLNESPLGPFFALIPQLRGISITGTGTGFVELKGDLATPNADGNYEFSTEGITGSARFSQLNLLVQDTPLNAVGEVIVDLTPSQITFQQASFSGGGSNVTIAGTKALTDDGMNNLSIDGRINLGLLNAFPAVTSSDTFFGGYSTVSIRLAGVNRTARISGTATLENTSVAAFIGSDRLTFDRLKGRILFSSNQAQLDGVSGYLGGGEVTVGGGALFGDGLRLDSFRLALNGTNVTVPFPEDFITTGDARLEITGRRLTNNLLVRITGNIIARRGLYTQDIELANIVGARGDGSLSGGGSSSILAPQFDLTIEGRDALIVRNNIADLTASASLRITGNANNPQISGRITANSGTVFFRNDRYTVQRGVLEFPPNTEIDPVINLQAETEIGGYQIFVNLSGPLTDTEQLAATVRSSPALPQADVISLITTGNLSNTEAGIPTLAQSGINTAAEILTDAIINNPARKATDKLFGLNVFEIDPILAGQQLNPTARLTVGRQINNNLRVTFATNLSQDQNQVLALEYRVSNKLSFVAQYEHRSLTNVTRNRDNFSFEIRFRRRF